MGQQVHEDTGGTLSVPPGGPHRGQPEALLSPPDSWPQVPPGDGCGPHTHASWRDHS